jgi:hypothetical protein
MPAGTPLKTLDNIFLSAYRFVGHAAPRAVLLRYYNARVSLDNGTGCCSWIDTLALLQVHSML